MAHTMTEDEWREFVTAGSRSGRPATVGRDGVPGQVVVRIRPEQDVAVSGVTD